MHVSDSINSLDRLNSVTIMNIFILAFAETDKRLTIVWLCMK